MSNRSLVRCSPGAGSLELSSRGNEKDAKNSLQQRFPFEMQEVGTQEYRGHECCLRCCGTAPECATRRLLLTSCSATKRHDDQLLPALKHYDGGIYRVIRAHRCEGLFVWIISAEFGLISERRLIPDYEQRLLPSRAEQLEPIVSARLDRILRSCHFSSVFVNLGKMYAQTVRSSLTISQMRSDGLVCDAYGGIGQRLHQAKQWLVGCPIEERRNPFQRGVL